LIMRLLFIFPRSHFYFSNFNIISTSVKLFSVIFHISDFINPHHIVFIYYCFTLIEHKVPSRQHNSERHDIKMSCRSELCHLESTWLVVKMPNIFLDMHIVGDFASWRY